MLLCLLADGRQLTLEEIDRVLVYLLEKKAKMLTLPSGTLPPLPVQYVTGALPTERETNPPKVDNSLSSTLAEQIRQILANRIVPPPPPVQETPALTATSIKSEHSNVMNTGYSLPPTYPTFKSNPLTSNYSLPPANLYSLSLTDPIYHSFPQMPLLPPPPLNPKKEN